MLIKEFAPTEEYLESEGLKDIRMPRLGQFVLLAGKNGAGKSRLLRLLFNMLTARVNSVTEWSTITHNFNSYDNAIKTNPDAESATFKVWKDGRAECAKRMALKETLIRSDESDNFSPLYFVPTTLNFQDPRGMNFASLSGAYETAPVVSLNSFGSVCFPYIQKMVDYDWDARHQDYSFPDKEEKKKSFIELNDLFWSLLGTRVVRANTGEANIFGKALADSKMSDGQKILIQLAVAIHARGSSLNRTVFILDELENHLHPSVSVEILERLTQAAPQCQIWLATHSIPLIAYVLSVAPQSLWFMNDHTVSHAGRKPEQVLHSLLGDEERIRQLRYLTGLPAELAMVNFAVESLYPPMTVAAERGDRQLTQIAGELQRLQSEGLLSVLDFGAGKGRLLEGLAAASNNYLLRSKINYVAFDPYPSDREVCCELISQYYLDSEKRHFSDEDSYFAEHGDSSIDVVVMCNVFHEIPPHKWISLFAKESLLSKAVHDSGYLLLVEDQCIPVGEKAHDYGFLVLDQAHLRTLFCVTNKQIEEGLFKTTVHPENGRLKAHLISRKLFSQITTHSRKEALTQLKHTAFTTIQAIRNEAPSYPNGQKHAFWTQQLANTYIFLTDEGG